MSVTNFGLLTDEQLTVWQRDVWRAARNAQFLKRFIGNDENAMIQRIAELKKDEKGARAVITLVADLEGDGVAGDRTLEGNEEAMKSYDQVIQLDQLRHANKHEGRMADQKSVVRFRENSRNVLGYWLADRTDQLAFLTLSGVSYAFHTNGKPRVGSDFPYLQFAADVKAPSANRHFRWDSTTKALEAGDTTAVDATDTPSWEMLVQAKAIAKEQNIRPIRGAEGMELFNIFMNTRGIAKLKLDPSFLAAWKDAQKRGPDNPLFKGTDVIHVDGLAIYDYRHVYNTLGAASGSKWGAAGTINGQRTLLCGAQAMGFADIGNPYWVEKEFDYDNQPGISVGKIMGALKPQFRSQITDTVEDFGVMVVDTAI